MEYIAPRDMTVTSVSGRSVEFKKGEPTFAPPQMHAELIAKGVVPTEEVDEPVRPSGSEPSAADEREAAMFAAFEKMILANKRGDFAGTGIPHRKALATILGWTSVDAKEVEATWKKYEAIQAEGK